MTKFASAFTFTALMVSIIGCSAGPGAAEDGVAEGVPLESTTTLGLVEAAAITKTGGETDKAVCIFDAIRTDVVQQSVVIGNGPFAFANGCGQVCPANSFVYEVFTQAETNQGGGDDTALNGIWFACFDRTNGAFTGAITGDVGPWGSKPLTAGGATNLGLFHGCQALNTGNPFVGGQMVIEGNRGGGVDDTAANRVFITCKDTTSFLATPAPTNFGSFTQFRQCPAGTAVCGINTGVEGDQHAGDDTALNSAAIHCCAF
jgi:hypothetical protein